MRVISQGGNIDVPYKISTIFKIENTILARNGRTEFELAEYSTEAKAIKAMEILRKSYENNEFYHHISTTDTFKDITRLLNNEEFNEVTRECFQFPQDDEIEV